MLQETGIHKKVSRHFVDSLQYFFLNDSFLPKGLDQLPSFSLVDVTVFHVYKENEDSQKSQAF
jgi:hypothetical protein